MKLSIIILNYRTASLTLDCLRSLEPQVTALADARAIIVDNCSDDGSAEVIARAIDDHGWSGRAQLVPNAVNGGFSHGNNLGMRSRHADAHLLLNSDTLVQPGAIAQLRDAAQLHPSAGIIGPRLQWPDGTPQVSAFRDIRPASELIRSAGTGPITRMLRGMDVPICVSDEPMFPQWVSFAACLIRREVFEQIGPMDEGYFMYFDDADYCRRARAAGWQVLYWPAARIVHLRGGSSPVKAQSAQRRRLSRYYYESRSRYFTRFHGRAGLWAANLMWTAGRSIAWLRETFGHKQPHACEHEWRDIWIPTRQTQACLT